MSRTEPSPTETSNNPSNIPPDTPEIPKTADTVIEKVSPEIYDQFYRTLR